MRIAIAGKRAKVFKPIKLGVSQLELLRILSTGRDWTEEDILKAQGKTRHGPLDRMLHGLIKRGFVSWRNSDVDGILIYDITCAGIEELSLSSANG